MPTYVHKDNEERGPFEDNEIIASLRNGTFSPEDLAWRDGFKQWTPLGKLYPAATPRLTPPPVRTAQTFRLARVAAQTDRTSGQMTASQFEREGVAALVIAAIAPFLWKPLFLLSVGLVLAALVIGIISVVRGRVVSGILLIVFSPVAGLFALAGLAYSR
jgi:GYF domain 2